MLAQSARRVVFMAVAAASVATVSPAFARANCYKWDGSDSFRCFDCMKQARIEGGWHRVNTCAPRQAPKPEYPPRY